MAEQRRSGSGGIVLHLELILLVTTGRRSVGDVEDRTVQQLPGCVPPAADHIPLMTLHIS